MSSNAPTKNPTCGTLHTREVTKPTLEELRAINTKSQTETLSKEDNLRIALADKADLETVIGESLTLIVKSVGTTVAKK